MIVKKKMSARREGQQRRLLAVLADGAFHSGERIAKRTKVSRSAVWKQIVSLRDLGLEVHAVTHQGYRLPRPVQLYDAKKISAALSAATARQLETIETLLEVDSTNRFLTDAAGPEAGQAKACVAELQSAGRGRRGRSWIAPFGGSLCLSLAWQFAETPPELSALSLAVGVALVKALERFGAAGVQLKWPNDLLWKDRKLGGILLEMKSESAGPARVVIGIGLNVLIPAPLRLEMAEKQAVLVADLHEILREKMPDRNAIVAAFIDELVILLQQFEREGFEPFREQWLKLDALAGEEVKLMLAQQSVQGTARGVAEDGALLLEVDGVVHRCVSGEVSVRRVRS